MRNRLVLSTLTLVLGGGLLSPAQAQSTTEDYHLELGVNFWKPSPELSIGSGGSPEVDLVSTFGIEDKWFTGFNATIKAAKKHKIRFSYVQMKYEKDATITQTIVFGGRTFTVNLPASTAIDWSLLRIGYEWDFVSNKVAMVGLLADLKYNHVKANVTSAPVNLDASTDTKAPIPTIGGIARGYVVPGLVSANVEITGFRLPSSDTRQGHYIDYDIYGLASIGKYVGVQGGYRNIHIDYLIDDDSGDLRMKGPYLGASVKF